APSQGVRGKLATARLTLMILFPMPGMAIFLVPVRSACGARVSDDHGCWWPPYVWDCFCSTVARNRVASITCVALPTKQQVNTNATSLDIEVDNIRRRWYEIAVSTVGTTVPSQIRLLGPENRGFWSRILLNDVSVRPGASIAIFADGQSLLALGMHVLDLVVTAVTGKPVPGDLIDDALLIANGINCPFGFGASVGAHLAQGNVPE